MSALIFLLASLSCTPLKILFGFRWPLRLRRTLGLLCFFSVLAHFLVYAVLDQYLILRSVFLDVSKRPFIAIGFIGLLLLIPLAVTSPKAALQRMGAKRWRRLHMLAYVVAVLRLYAQRRPGFRWRRRSGRGHRRRRERRREQWWLRRRDRMFRICAVVCRFLR